ncbi:MAG: alpha/beta hydrolase [Armatimonadota bacterium]
MMTPLLFGLLLHAQKETAPFTVIEKVPYRTIANKKLLMDIYRPANVTGAVPVVLVIHGGSWIGGKRGDMGPICEALAKRGIAAATVDYRLAPSSRWPAMLEDCEVAYNFLVSKSSAYRLSKDRFGAVGASAGGHLAMLMAFKETEEGAQKAGVPKRLKFRGILNLFGPTQLTEDFPTSLQDAVSKTVIGKPYPESASIAASMSPVNFVNKTCPPVFTIHGEKDPLVPVMQAKRLDKALTAAGVVSVLRLIPEMGHELKIELPACSLAVDDGLAFLVKRLNAKK